MVFKLFLKKSKSVFWIGIYIWCLFVTHLHKASRKSEH